MRSSHAAIPEGWLGMECRTSRRAGLLVQVVCEAKGAYSLGRCQNISETGLLVQTQETFEPSTVATVRFPLPLPKANTIEAKGTVVHVQPGESMAIQFVELKEQYRTVITEFVKQADREGEVA